MEVDNDTKWEDGLKEIEGKKEYIDGLHICLILREYDLKASQI